MLYELHTGEITEDEVKVKETAIKMAEDSIQKNPSMEMVGFPLHKNQFIKLCFHGKKDIPGRMRPIKDPVALKKYKEYLVQSFISDMEITLD